jgi:hypothetical protein
MARAVRKSSRTGTVEIKHCGFNERPRLMVAGPAGDDEDATDVLPELFSAYEGKKVKVTIEVVKP